MLHLVAAPAARRIAGAFALISVGIHKFVRPRSHPTWVGMRVTAPELVLSSFFMSPTHGAGLMLVPVLLRLPANRDGHNHVHGMTDTDVATVLQDLAAVLVHSGAMLVVMGVVAVVVYEKVGVTILRCARLNLDLIGAGAAGIAGVATLCP